ncbi:hypothetical protein EG329_007471 [Mollisiaceae sp. DMI_Dod_QoI]|nr:hypothetical protein EG329_007471 [Helotiales sp. DMI_Dod_QoI]
MSSSKGKSRATGNEDNELETPESSAEPSIFSRVTASASGLTRNTFASSSRNELNEHAAAALADAGKGHSLSGTSGQSSWAESSKLSHSANHSQTSGSSGLRARHSEAHATQSEHEFSTFLDRIDSFTPSESPEDTRTATVSGRFEKTWARSHNIERPPDVDLATITVAEQERRDGEDVSHLLSDPAVVDEQFELREEDEEHYDWGLSRDQVIELRAMTKDIFPPPEQFRGIAPGNPLNLVPMSDEYDQNQWFEQWDGVLNRYADEVWGGLLPLVKEARKEIDDMRNDESVVEQPKALRRLNAILGHLQRR